ncbi:putative prolycopenC2 and GRAM domain-containing protein [Helianthus debilis subsp. tardiflorus]
MLRVVLLCLILSLQFIMLFACFSLHLANGSGHGSKRNGSTKKEVVLVRVKTGSGRNGFGSEQVLGQSGFQVGFVKNVFLKRLYIKGQFCSVRNGTGRNGTDRNGLRRNGTSGLTKRMIQYAITKTLVTVCDYEDFGHKTKFSFLWEDVEDIHSLPPTLASVGSPILVMVLLKGRGVDARHGAKSQDEKGRLYFYFHSFVSFSSARR